jgi:hypothetical protein
LLQPKSFVKSTNAYPQSFTEKLVAVLRKPLITIPLPFPAKKKPAPPEAIKTVKPKKTVKQKRSALANNPAKPMPLHNMPTGNNTGAHIFTPAANREEFEKIIFVLKACDKNSGRAFTNVLHIERLKNGSRLVATDGKRMHVSEIRAKVKPGDYKPVVVKGLVKLGMPVPDAGFPDWERAVPTDTVYRGCISFANAVVNENSGAYAAFSKMGGEKVNPSYLSDLTKKAWLVYRQNEKRKALLLKEYGDEKKTYAVIMPLSA